MELLNFIFQKWSRRSEKKYFQKINKLKSLELKISRIFWNGYFHTQLFSFSSSLFSNQPNIEWTNDTVVIYSLSKQWQWNECVFLDLDRFLAHNCFWILSFFFYFLIFFKRNQNQQNIKTKKREKINNNELYEWIV